MDGVAWLVLAIIVVAVAVVAAKKLTPTTAASNEDGEGLSGFPYKRRELFLSPAERCLYGVLRALAERSSWDVFAKVRLEDIVEVAKGTDKFQAHRNRIKSRHIDFLICDRQTVFPIVAIELNDATHARSDRQQRDIFVSGALDAAGLPLVVIPAQRTYTMTELSELIQQKTAAGIPTTATEEQLVIERTPRVGNTDPLSCPRCGSLLVERQARRTGERFLGCSKYPACHHMEPIVSS